MRPEHRLIVSLEAPWEEALEIAETLQDVVKTVMLASVLKEDLQRIRTLRKIGFNVIADLKLFESHSRLVYEAERLNVYHPTAVTALTQNGIAGMNALKAALIRISVITSPFSTLNDDECEAVFKCSPKVLLWQFAKSIQASGVTDIFCSAKEFNILRLINELRGMKFYVSDIWPTSEAQGKRMTVGKAIEEGATYVIIGDPIVRSQDPRAAARKILKELTASVASKDTFQVSDNRMKKFRESLEE